MIINVMQILYIYIICPADFIHLHTMHAGLLVVLPFQTAPKKPPRVQGRIAVALPEPQPYKAYYPISHAQTHPDASVLRAESSVAVHQERAAHLSGAAQASQAHAFTSVALTTKLSQALYAVRSLESAAIQHAKAAGALSAGADKLASLAIKAANLVHNIESDQRRLSDDAQIGAGKLAELHSLALGALASSQDAANHARLAAENPPALDHRVEYEEDYGGYRDVTEHDYVDYIDYTANIDEPLRAPEEYESYNDIETEEYLEDPQDEYESIPTIDDSGGYTSKHEPNQEDGLGYRGPSSGGGGSHGPVKTDPVYTTNYLVPSSGPGSLVQQVHPDDPVYPPRRSPYETPGSIPDELITYDPNGRYGGSKQDPERKRPRYTRHSKFNQDLEGKGLEEEGFVPSQKIRQKERLKFAVQDEVGGSKRDGKRFLLEKENTVL